MPYRCRYCGGTYCPDHRLPENHQCPGLTNLKDNPRWRDYAAQVRRRDATLVPRHDRWDREEESARSRIFGGSSRSPFGAPVRASRDIESIRNAFAGLLMVLLVLALMIRLLL